MKSKALLLGLGLTLALGLPAAGQFGFYVGGSVGQGSLDTDLDELELSIDGDDFAYKLFVGLKIGKHFGLEGGWRDLGTIEEISDDVLFSSATDGFDLFLMGRTKLGPVTLFAKGGVFVWDSSLSLDDVDIDDDGSDLAWGLGLSFKLIGIGIRIEYEQFEVATPDDLAMVSAGITLGF